MKRIEKGCLVLMAALALVATVRASIENPDSSDRSYQVIVDRNPFNLRDPIPLAPPPQPTNPPAKSNLKLTGFMTLREKRAFFVLIDEKTKTNQPISLAIDQELDGLKVLDIDPVSRQVRVVRDGVEKLMAFATDAITNQVATAAPVGTPGVPGLQPGVPTRPGSPPMPTVTPGAVAPGTTSPNTSPPAFRSIPSRNLRTSTANNPQPIYAGAGAAGTEVTRLNTRGSTPPPLPTPQPDGDAMQQMILMEAQRALNPSLPPTPGLPPELGGATPR